MRLSSQISGGSGTQSTTIIWTSPILCPILGKSAAALCPEEEAWLDIYLDDLVAKGVIGPILARGAAMMCYALLLLVPGV